MKNSGKKFLSMLLVLCMLAGLTVSAFADSVENYVMIGDSISIYCGTSATGESWVVYTKPNTPFPGTYSEKLLNDQELGIKSICSFAHSGWRVQEALYALGGTDYTADYFMKYAGDKVSRIKEYSPTYIQAVKDADLISIQLGFNNIMHAFIYGMYTAFEQEGTAFEGSALDKQIIASLDKLEADAGDTEAMVSLLNALETTERGVVLLKNALKMMPRAISEFQKSWDELMERIYDVNPDVKVLVLGLYNPVGEAVKKAISDNVSLSASAKSFLDTAAWLIKEATDPTVDALNLYLRSGNRFAKRYEFVDIGKVDFTGTADGVHMGSAGHQYVYEQLKKVIVTHYLPESVPATKTTPTGLLDKLFSGLRNLF